MMSDEKLRLVHCFLRDHGFERTAKCFEKEVGRRLTFDSDHFIKSINDGNFDEAVDYAAAFLKPKENLVALNIIFELRKQQFMELLRDPNEESCPRKFFVDKLKPIILLNRTVFKGEDIGLDKTYELIHNFSDLLVMTKEEQKEMTCLRGSIRSQRRLLSELLLKILDHSSLALKFEYEQEVKGLKLSVARRSSSPPMNSAGQHHSGRNGTAPYKLGGGGTKPPRRSGTARKCGKGVKRARTNNNSNGGGSSKQSSNTSNNTNSSNKHASSEHHAPSPRSKNNGGADNDGDAMEIEQAGEWVGIPGSKQQQQLQQGEGGEDGAIRGSLFTRIRVVRMKDSVAALAFHPKDPSLVLVGTFGGYFKLMHAVNGTEYAMGKVEQKNDPSHHAITKIKWDNSGLCACLSGANPAIYVITWKKEGRRETLSDKSNNDGGGGGGGGGYKLDKIRKIRLNLVAGEFDSREILNDFVFLTSPNQLESHLLCANDLHLRHHGYSLAKIGGGGGGGGFTEFKSPRTLEYPSEPCVSLATLQIPSDESGAKESSWQQHHHHHHHRAYGITLMGDVIIWDPFDRSSPVRLFRGKLRELVPCSTPVVDKWLFIVENQSEEEEAIEEDSSSTGATSKKLARLSKREASVQGPAPSLPTVRMLASFNDVGDSNPNRYIADVPLKIENDGTLQKDEEDTTSGRNRMACFRPGSTSEVTDWVISGEYAIVADQIEAKAWALDGHITSQQVPLWIPKKGKDDQNPDVSRVATNAAANILCVSKANAITVLKVL